VGQKGKPAYFCNNLSLLPTNFHNFLAHIDYRKFATGIYIGLVSTPDTVCVTALPCKILITTHDSTHMFVHLLSYKKICTLDTIHVKKQHNTHYGILLKCYPSS